MSVHQAIRVNGWDDVNISLIPTDAAVIFYYADGTYQEHLTALQAHAPKAHLVPIVVRAGDTVAKAKRLYLDDEPGDATNDEVVAWWHLAKEAGVEVPGVYTSVSNGEAMCGELERAGLVYGKDFTWWSAHYTGVPHLCSPACGFGVTRTAHNTQYADNALGRSLDADLCTDWGVGLTPPAVNLPHYDWYSNVVQSFLGGRSERECAAQYDELRAKYASNDPLLHELRDLCSQCGVNVRVAIENDLVNGKQDPGLFHRGWRETMLDKRANGQKVVS
jgi:hypothetical protein